MNSPELRDLTVYIGPYPPQSGTTKLCTISVLGGNDEVQQVVLTPLQAAYVADAIAKNYDLAHYADAIKEWNQNR